ncbi:MAG: hypothetical protein KatS3mg068_1528 [Candidatus Sericytochromatia bacterium]|nr:MAG: hypothetical protein KatS3mg068_1528 [Candidatus Sericytochromatia bacterium]
MELYELENDFFGKVAEVESYYLGKYLEVEKKSFDAKVQEAKTFLNTLDNNDCPIILEELRVFYGREPTQQEIIDRCNIILYKKDILAKVSGKISGLRQIYESNPYNFDFSLFNTYFPEVFSE